jgi:hypothetical protein
MVDVSFYDPGFSNGGKTVFVKSSTLSNSSLPIMCRTVQTLYLIGRETTRPSLEENSQTSYLYRKRWKRRTMTKMRALAPPRKPRLSLPSQLNRTLKKYPSLLRLDQMVNHSREREEGPGKFQFPL